MAGGTPRWTWFGGRSDRRRGSSRLGPIRMPHPGGRAHTTDTGSESVKITIAPHTDGPRPKHRHARQ